MEEGWAREATSQLQSEVTGAIVAVYQTCDGVTVLGTIRVPKEARLS
jgi:hypothetical protein